MEEQNYKSLLAISFSPGFVSPNIPIATFRQGNKELNFILDTGSDNNVIDKNALNSIEHTIDETKQINLSGVGGVQCAQICDISFQYDDKEYTEQFLISDLNEAFTLLRKCHAIPLHGMLGSCFMQKNKFVLDFNNMVAYNKE